MMQMVSGDDDSVYLYNPAKIRTVSHVQATGKVTEITLGTPKTGNTLPLELLASHTNLYLAEAELAPGQRVEDVTELGKFLISVFDRYSGTLDRTYEIEKPFGANPLAASPKEFYFFSAKVLPTTGLGFSIVRAQP